jgi:hypothetical protein
MRFVQGAFLLLLGAFAASPAAAQAVVKGRIVTDAGGKPLDHAEVMLDGANRSATTNEDGRFRIGNIPIGVYTLYIRRIGFQPEMATLRIESADSVDLDLAMYAVVPQLEELIATGHVTGLSPSMAEFAERKRVLAGFGKFLGPDELRKGETLKLADLLQDQGVTIAKNNHGQAFAMGRGGLSLSSPESRCPMVLVWNGIRFSFTDSTSAAPLDLNNYSVSSLGAVEIYPRTVDAPIQYGGPTTPCGVIVLRSREQ